MEQSEIAGLVAGCQQGDEAAIERFVAACQPPVYRLALSVLDDPDEACEAAQEALVAALARLGSYRGDSAFTTWLFAIALNVCRGRLRKRRARERLTKSLQALWLLKAGGDPGVEERALRDERDAALWAALGRLDEKLRLPLILRYYHDLPVDEIARLLRLKPGTVASRLFTARERLRQALGENEGFQ